jgi:serine/threonine-protein kinase
VVDSSADLDVRARSRVGSWLRDKYRLDRVLGVGGMATVYSVTHRNGRRFALKMLHAEHSLRKDVRKRFLREGYIANVVDHPGAVAVLDDDVAEDGSAFLVMELLDGDTVDGILARDGKLAESVVLALAAETLDVLAAAHERNVVHRDIKPANVFVTRTGEVKVLDFGIARLRAAESASATGTGMALGTPAFMSPEQAMGKEADARSDVFSVGAMMFTLLAGAYVHEGEVGQELMVRAATEPARPLVSLVPGVSPSVAAIVDKALAFSPLDRWQTASEMRGEVRQVYSTLHASESPRARLAQLVARERAITVIGPSSGRSDPHGPTLAAPTTTHEDPAHPGRAPLTAGGVATETPEPATPAARTAMTRRAQMGWIVLAAVGGAVLGALLLVKVGGGPAAGSASSSSNQASARSMPQEAPAAASSPAAPSVVVIASSVGEVTVAPPSSSAPRGTSHPPPLPLPRASAAHSAAPTATSNPIDPLAP